MRESQNVAEHEMACPVLELFPAPMFSQFKQVPLGRKRIDLVFVRQSEPLTISVELKVADWKKALWQASVNWQVCDESYIAIWHKFAHRATKRIDLLNVYGVGLIVVDRTSARVLLPSVPAPRRIPLNAKGIWYRQLLGETEQRQAETCDIT